MIDFHIDWMDAPGVRDPVLARTWCALTVSIDGAPVTRVFDRRTKGWRDSVYGSVFPLCCWLVDNLWFLLYEPYRWPALYGSRDLARSEADRPWVHRHGLLAAREGGALPDLTFFRDGDAVLARWLKDGGDASHPHLRFVQEGQARLAPETVRAGIEVLVESVLERISGLHHADVVGLRDDWADLCNLNADERNLCAWAARLGINAHYDDELPDRKAERLRSTIEGLEHRLADDLLDVATLDAITRDLDWIDEARRKTSVAHRSSPDDGHLGPWQAPVSEPVWTAYAAGYRQARALRDHAGLGAEVLSDLSGLMRHLGWADPPLVATDTKPSSDLRAVVGYGREGAPVAATQTGATQTSERFLLARSLFLQTRSAAPERRLVTGSHTWHQRASRAFAAELLAPADALRQRFSAESVSRREVAQCAAEFRVDAALIERQIENHAVARVDRGRRELSQW